MVSASSQWFTNLPDSTVLSGAYLCPAGCWILHRVAAELARVFASELNQGFFVGCGRSELMLLYQIKGVTAFKTIVATGAHLWIWGYAVFPVSEALPLALMPRCCMDCV